MAATRLIAQHTCVPGPGFSSFRAIDGYVVVPNAGAVPDGSSWHMYVVYSVPSTRCVDMASCRWFSPRGGVIDGECVWGVIVADRVRQRGGVVVARARLC